MTPIEHEDLLDRLEELEERVRILELNLDYDDTLIDWVDDEDDDDLLD
jgi:hypothetical protein